MDEDTALGQIEYLEDSLRRADVRYADVQRALRDAQTAFDAAKRTLDTVTAQADELVSSRLALRGDINSRRSALELARREAQALGVRRILGNFPHELLRCIFLAAVQSREDVWPNSDDWGRRCKSEHIRIPFTLAAVSRQWRDVALQVPDLWTFMAVADCEDDDSPYLPYVKRLLARSKRHRLDVLLLWSDCRWETSEQYGEILAALGRHAHRLRRLSVTIPIGTPESALHLFRLPMPVLEGLKWLRAGPELLSSTAPSTYFPFCPQLRRVVNNVLFSIPLTPLPQICDLAAFIDSSPLSAVWTFLGMLPSVQRLRLVFEDNPIEIPTGTPPGPLHFPKLEELCLLGLCDLFSPWTLSLEMPILQELRLEDDTIAIFPELFEKIADSLRTLAICVDSPQFSFADRIHDIRRLRNLRTIVVRDCTAVGRDFSTVFASREAAGLPLLETIWVRNVKLDESQAAHVSCLMRKLHAHAASGADDALAFKFTVEKPDEVPDWLLRQYEFITSGEGDGVNHATDAESESEPADSETEAVFTDGGTGGSYTSDSEWQQSESEDEDEDEEVQETDSEN